jgi:TolB-like protein/DNA-binding winged helix-turn-helix (wHTH) protein/Tfp pilus assembly protein PilF
MAPSTIKFGPFELDRANFELRREGKPVKLDRTPLELLFFLAERAGTLVTREEAVKQVWGEGVFIEAESSLYTAVRKIRRVLDDDIGEPKFVQTVSGKGYRFIARVDSVAGPSVHQASRVLSRPAVPRWFLWSGLVALLAGVALFGWLRTVRNGQPADRVMLVVLPLENLNGDPREDYLADGITEEIITQLGGLDPRHLGVIARTSAMRYNQMSVTDISRELGVAYVLAGSIRRSGGHVRVTAQLIQSSDQTNLWAKSYDQDLSDVLQMEHDIAGMAASEVRLTLSEQVHERLTAATRVNPEAHDAYLRGLQGWNQRTREGFLQAIADFIHATQLDPNYAAAFAGLARVYSLAPVFADMPPSEAVPKALDASNRALQLDDTLSDAHSALAFVKGHYEYDWVSAEREYLRAIELDPNNPYGHFFYSNSFLSPFGRHEEAITEMKKAMELDPVSTRIQSFAGRTFTWARRYDEAFAQYQKVNQLDPNIPVNHERLAQLYAVLAKFDDAIAEETKARMFSGESPQRVLEDMNNLHQAVMNRGAQGSWEGELRLALSEQNPPESYARPFGFAQIYGQLGEKDKAFANLEIALRERDTQMTELGVDPQFDVLRSDPRFLDLERKVCILSH